MQGSDLIASTRVEGFIFVVDDSDLDPPYQPLALICKGCGHIFRSDYEERFCGGCVQRRELLNLPTIR